jgi:hypothetical protein
MKKIITGLFILSFSFMLNSQTKKAGTIIKISGSEITVKNENAQKPFQMGENLRLLTGDESVILRVVFAMQTSAKCTLVSGNIKSLKIGSVVYSGEQQSKKNTALKPLTKLQPVEIESIKLDDFNTFLGFSKGDSIDSILNIFGSPFIKTPMLEMSGFTSKNTLIWWDITDKNHVFLGIVSESVNTQKIVSVITISSKTKKGNREYYQDTTSSGTVSFLLSKGIDDSKLNLLGTPASKIISIFGEPIKRENGPEFYTYSYLSSKGTKILFRFYGHENLLHTIEIHF